LSRGGLGGIAPPEATADGDLLAVRLVLLGTRYREAVTVDDQATKTAGQMLARWRERVAAWAQSPSGAPAARYLEAVVEAFENDLDTPAALREMAALEADETVTDGAKFETFAAADRLLGLDVASQVGRGLHNVRSVLRALTQRIAVRTHDRDTYLTRRSLYP
jgi:cysteinyl-tRNA synthetase